jgi:hypothetical protein
VGFSVVIDDSWNIGLVNVYTTSSVVGAGAELQGVVGSTVYDNIFTAYDDSQMTNIGGSVSIPQSPLSRDRAPLGI